MNTGNFISDANNSACRLQNDLDVICNVRSTSGKELGIPINPGIIIKPVPPPKGPPLSLQELQRLNTLIVLSGRGTLSPEMQSDYDNLYKRYVDNGGTFPIILPYDPNNPVDPNNPTAGSFASHSIDSIWDLLNFLKAAFIMSLAASVNPHLILPTKIILGISFIYALRKKINLK